MEADNDVLQDVVQGKTVTVVDATRRLGTQSLPHAGKVDPEFIKTFDRLVQLGILSIVPSSDVASSPTVSFSAPYIKAVLGKNGEFCRNPSGPRWRSA